MRPNQLFKLILLYEQTLIPSAVCSLPIVRKPKSTSRRSFTEAMERMTLVGSFAALCLPSSICVDYAAFSICLDSFCNARITKSKPASLDLNASSLRLIGIFWHCTFTCVIFLELPILRAIAILC